MSDKTIDELLDTLPLFFTTKQILELFPFGKTKLYSLLKEHLFPNSSYFLGNKRIWVKTDVVEFVKNGFKMTDNLLKKYDPE
jgi:hypothetical protein